ncbi:unnamed protein product [Parnassius mnemosyne]|uniref:NADH dehydrogenase subunit 5 C-terminal domain-containing protein n=1 Tax=Parnassius mnemosyne TaxID=213953 RepID=A0AAV1KTL5_9NEOP
MIKFLIIIIFIIPLCLTIFYTIRLLIYLIINDYNLFSIYNLYDEDYVILKSIFLLLFISLITGRFLM